MYVLWTKGAEQVTADRRNGIAAELADAGASHIQFNLDDDAVADAAPLRIESSEPAPTGTISMWLDSAIDALRSPVDAAIATVAPFAGYLVSESIPLRSLTDDAPPYAAIVEELFPPEAMTSPHAFFDAVTPAGDDDHERLRRNVGLMIESTSRFLDLDQIDVFPTSHYLNG